MSHWQALGLPGSPASAGVEGLAKWIQWAMTGVLSDVSGSSAYVADNGEVHMASNEDLIRYNLRQFWDAKASVLSSAGSDEEKRQIYRLDAMSHGILNAVDSGKLTSASPTYWAFWRAWWVGGAPDRPQTEAIAEEARQAALDAAEASSDAGLPTMAEAYRQIAANVDQNLIDSNQWWSQPGALNVAGVPWWAWVAGAAAAFYLIERR